MRYLHTSGAGKNTSIPLHSLSLSKLLALLSSCKNFSSLLQIHACSIVSGLHCDHLTSRCLIESYVRFKRCDLSRSLFDSMPNPSVMLCNSMIRAYTKAKDYPEALRLYRLLLSKGLVPDKYTLTFVLKACTRALDFKGGVVVHSEVVSRGLECDAFIGAALVDMYCKMGDLVIARQVFDRMPHRDVVAWNAIILGLSHSVNPSEALEFVKSMQFDGVEPDVVTILNLVPAVSGLGLIDACRSVHCYTIRRGFDEIVSNGLVDMYAKCGKLDMARQVFEQIQDKNDVSWGTMMAGYAHNRFLFEVIELFDRVKGDNVRLNKASIVSSLLAAAEMGDLRRGKEIHDCAVQQGIDSDVVVATSIMSMYAKCGDLNRAKQLFQELKVKDLIARSAIIAAFVQSGNTDEALSMFRDMQKECLNANKVILVSVLPACADVSSPRSGKSVHCSAVKANVDSDVSVGTALLSMYVKSGYLASAMTVFNRMPYKDVTTWNALINGYVQIGDACGSIEMFHKLRLTEIHPDSGTMVGLLPACALLHDIGQGSCTHGHIIKCGFESDFHVQNALIDMYAKCGSLLTAEFLFNRPSFSRNEVSWNIMIGGYMHSGHAKEAISAFSLMKLEAFQPNLVTIVSVLPAAAFLSALREGTTLHACIIRMGFQSNTLVGNFLVDMYAKCGQLGYSETVFSEINYKDTASYNVMLAAYSAHGQGRHAIELFSLMQERQIRVDHLSFISVLSACGHAGLIKEGRKLFDSMRKKHRLEPAMEHYACMIDLLGRAGLFDDILHLIEEMPLEPDAEMWGTLLGACILHSNLELAEFAVDHLLKLDPENPIHHVALSSLYANCGRWEDAANTRSKINKTGLRKSPGYSWVSARR